jgi:hypothetical protein
MMIIFNGLIGGGVEEYNMYCLEYDFDVNTVIQFKTKEGVTKRYKIKEISSLGDTVNVLKRYIIISIVV